MKDASLSLYLQVELREKMEIIAQLRREIEIYKEENYKQAEIGEC